jgi:putative membrane protein insertion efficiency factor
MVGSSWAERIILGMIRFYQIGISPRLPPSWRFSPSCSAYAAEAVDRFGAGKGVWLSINRLFRCHPFGGKGYDPVPQHDGA